MTTETRPCVVPRSGLNYSEGTTVGTVDIVREQMPLAVLAFGIIAIYVILAVRNAFR